MEGAVQNGQFAALSSDDGMSIAFSPPFRTAFFKEEAFAAPRAYGIIRLLT